MGRIKDFHKALAFINMDQLCLDVTLSLEDVATNMNTDQLFKGERSDGSNLPDYSPASVNVFGKPQGPIRLFDSGDFYRGFIFANAQFPLFFTSTDEKTDELTFDYGENIFGLNQENKTDLAKSYILPELKKEFLKRVDV